MIRYHDHTLGQYLEKLSAREPVPGGGSAAALSGAMGAGLIEMVTRYSQGKGKPAEVEAELTSILERASHARFRLLDLVSLDSEAYLAMREAKKIGPSEHKAATEKAAAVPREIRTLCEATIKLTRFLRQEGNPYLLSDVIAAEAFLKAGIDAAQAMIETNS